MKKQFIAQPFDTNREMVEYINSNHIKKEDIVDIYYSRGLVILYYYK